MKHARATEVTPGIPATGDRVVVSVADNRHGLAGGGESRAPYRTAPGQGLENIRRRLADRGGTCTIAGAEKGAGTTVTFSMPLT